MIKSSTMWKDEKRKQPYFPRLLINTITESIVLFRKNKEGTLLIMGSKETLPIGYFSCAWDMGDFVETSKKVILENAD